MSERGKNILIAVTMALLAAILGVLLLTAETEVDRVERLGTRIKCPVCQGESIANSPAQMARDMMSLVSQRVSEGASDESIVDELLGSYSGAVLLDPPISGQTLLLWLAPLAVAVGGAGVIVWWRRHPGPGRDTQESAGARPSRRTLAGGLILAGSFAVIVIAVGFFLQERPDRTEGIAGIDVTDLDSVSNETMEAAITANADNPQINGMRLALAERYYETGDYRGAFPHYLSVAESNQASSQELVAALVRLGWMAWDGNGEAEAAIGMLDQALAIDASSATALYLKGQVVWCGQGDAVSAATLFQEALATGTLGDDSRQLVETDLSLAIAGQECA